MAATRLDAAGSVNNSTTLSYSISAGTNRALIVGVTQTGASPTADYGGQSMASVGSVQYSGGVYCHVFFLNAAGIAAASGTTITISSGSGAHLISAQSYQDCVQTTPTNTNSGTADTTTPFSVTLTGVSAGSIVGALSSNEDLSAATWTVVSERTDLTYSSSPWYSSTYADLEEGTGGSISPSVSYSSFFGESMFVFEIEGQSGPVITDVNTTESWTDGATGLVITGTGFVV